MVAMSFGTTCRRGRHTSASGPHHVPRRARRCPRRHGGGPSEPVVVGRYYDTTTGQFLSVDPEISASHAPYSYVQDDPTNYNDPLGLLGRPSYCDSGSPYVKCIPTESAITGTSSDDLEAAARIEYSAEPSSVFFRTPLGARYVDVYVPNGGGIAVELKIGYQGGYRLENQARKDGWILAHGGGEGQPYQPVHLSEWWWYPNQNSTTGPSPSLLKVLTEEHIYNFIFYIPSPNGRSVAPSRQWASAPAIYGAGAAIVAGIAAAIAIFGAPYGPPLQET